MSDIRGKTAVTAISKISDRPVANEACLVVIYGLELGKKFNLNRPQIIIGRSSKADIQIDQEAVSRNHCKIINTGNNTGNAIMLRDMGSTNGTYVNDEMIDEYVLRDGDFIKVGRCIFKFLSSNNIENAYHEEIYRLTTFDGLTQVFNRRYFVETLEREIGRALRYRRDLSLIMFDIDRFKGVNDSFGHLAGDHVLKHLASAINTQIRREDVLARYGGEEFAIVLPEIDCYNAMQFAEKVRKLVEVAEFKFEDAIIPVTVSIGVASLRGEIEDTLEFIKNCDDALFAAKENGRNCVVSDLDASDYLPNPKIVHALRFRGEVLRNAVPSTVLVCVGLNTPSRDGLPQDTPRVIARWFQDLVVESCNDSIIGRMNDFILLASSGPHEATTMLRKIRDGVNARSTAKPAPIFAHGLSIPLAGLDLSQCIVEAISSLPDGVIPRWGFQLPLPLGIPLRSLFLAAAASQQRPLLLQLRDTAISWLLIWLASELAELHRLGVSTLSAEDQAGRFSAEPLARLELLKQLVSESAPHSSRFQSSYAWSQLFEEPSALTTLARLIETPEDTQATADYWPDFERNILALLRKIPLISSPMFVTTASKAPDDPSVTAPKFSATSELLIGDNSILPTEIISLSKPANSGHLFFFTPNAPPIAMEPFARFENCGQCQGRELFLLYSIEHEAPGSVYKSPTTGHLLTTSDVSQGAELPSRTRTDLVAPVITDVLLITTLEEERDAVLANLEYHMLPRASDDVGIFYGATIQTSNNEKLNVVVTMLQGMGPLQASTRAAYSVIRWLPRYVFVIGIAGGLAEATSLGDVIVASQIADYTVGKTRADGSRGIYWSAFPADAGLLESALSFKGDWSDIIKAPRPRAGKPRRLVGVFASGGDVVACKELLGQYSADWPKLVGVEMEGGGIATALHQSPSRPGFLMIRGVSDHADRNKGKPQTEKWRSYACEAAAAYSIHLLRSGLIRRHPDR